MSQHQRYCANFSISLAMNLSVLIKSSKNDGNGWVGLSSDIKQIDEIIDNLALQFDATIAVRHTTANIF